MPRDGSVIDLPADQTNDVDRRSGLEVTPNREIVGYDLTLYQSHPSGTTAEIYDTNGNVLASTTFGGSTVRIDYVQSSGTPYWVAIGDSIAGRKVFETDVSESFPVTSADADVTAGVSETNGTLSPTSGAFYRIDEITVHLRPAAPTNVSATPTAERELTLSWQDNSSIETDYYVYRAQSSGTTQADYTRVATLAADTTSYTDTGLSDGERYYYRVAAQGPDFEGELSVEADAVTTLPSPTGLSVSNVTATSADLSWTNNHNNGTVTVQYRQTSASTWTDAATGLSLSTESYTLSGLLNGEQYEARVAAVTSHDFSLDASNFDVAVGETYQFTKPLTVEDSQFAKPLDNAGTVQPTDTQ